MLKSKTNKILFIILLVSLLLRVFRIDYPNSYVFDEVYHAFTAKEYLKGKSDTWVWWSTPPKGVAYEWTHPPLAKEIMAGSMFILRSQDAWAWRLPGAVAGTLSILLVFYISKSLFKNDKTALISSFIFSLDGLSFVQARTGMNDIYLVLFILFCLLFLLKQRFLAAAIFFGLALATKWTAIYFLIIFLIFLIRNKKLKIFPLLLLIPVTVYLLSYWPFFTFGFNLEQFSQLQQQMWWYHTNLKASHTYASAWWSWPLNLVPVWYFVEYRGNQVANIFAYGNTILFMLGIAGTLISIFDFLKNRSFLLLLPLLCFAAFWLPWSLSPRIMFLYHYSPAVPFLTLLLGYQLSTFIKKRVILTGLLLAVALGFIIIYPILTGVFLPKNLLDLFFLVNLAKNPF